MNFKDYLALNRLSNSSLHHLAKSPKEFKYRMENKQEETEAMKIGRAVHSAILTPDLFKEEYTKAPKCDKRTKVGKETWEAFCLANQGKEVLDESTYDECVAISQSVLSSPKIKNMLAKGQSEVTYLYEIEGVEMKSRFDLDQEDFICDVKTTRSALMSDFARDFVNLGYDRQFGLYQHAKFLKTGKKVPVIILAVEKEAPYDYCVFKVPEVYIENGLRKAIKLIKLYKECVEKNEWPGLPKDIVELDILPWYKIEE